jgi:hypothetical protein
LGETEWKNRISKTGPDRIYFKINKEEIPKLTVFMVENKIQIFAVEPVRSLEEFFLQITEDGKAD